MVQLFCAHLANLMLLTCDRMYGLSGQQVAVQHRNASANMLIDAGFARQL